MKQQLPQLLCTLLPFPTSNLLLKQYFSLYVFPPLNSFPILSRGVSGYLKLGGQVVMWWRLLFCQKLVGQLPTLPTHHLRTCLDFKKVSFLGKHLRKYGIQKPDLKRKFKKTLLYPYLKLQQLVNLIEIQPHLHAPWIISMQQLHHTCIQEFCKHCQS